MRGKMSRVVIKPQSRAKVLWTPQALFASAFLVGARCPQKMARVTTSLGVRVVGHFLRGAAAEQLTLLPNDSQFVALRDARDRASGSVRHVMGRNILAGPLESMC